MDDKIRETLEKQMQLLSERSENTTDIFEIAEIAEEMFKIVIYESLLSQTHKGG